MDVILSFTKINRSIMTNNKQQTAVEWGIEKLASLTFDYMAGFISKREYDKLSKGVIRQAKEMEKEMTIKLYADYENYLEEAFKNQCGGQAVILSFQEFYEQRYGGSEQ
jgi:hypothetical protein